MVVDVTPLKRRHYLAAIDPILVGLGRSIEAGMKLSVGLELATPGTSEGRLGVKASRARGK